MKIETIKKYFLNDVEVEKKDIQWDNTDNRIVITNNECRVYTGKLSTRFKGPRMEKREFITVSVISSKLKDEVQKRMDGIDSLSKKDSNGRGLDFYEDLGIPPPEELLEDALLGTNEEDYVEVISEARIRIDLISFMVNNDDRGCAVYTEIDYKLTVEETAEELELKIKNAKYGI